MPPTRIPTLIQPYLYPTLDSLTLLTGILGAGTNWLVVKYIYAALSSEKDAVKGRSESANGTVPPSIGGLPGGPNDEGNVSSLNSDSETAVVLVSWMRDWEFWRQECRRGAGLDLSRLAQQKRLVYIDGLTKLFVPDAAPSNTSYSARPGGPPAPPSSARQATQLPARQPVDKPAAHSAPSQQPTNPTIYLTKPTLAHLSAAITTALSTLNKPNPKSVTLILDAPDLLQATADLSPSSATANHSETVTPAALLSTVQALRSHTHNTLVTLAADLPLVAAGPAALAHFTTGSSSSDAPLTPIHHAPLDTAHAALVTGMAHMADTIVSLRLLDTGVAGDVSGVLRAVGGADEEPARWEREVLYRVLGDGGVRVFERGAVVGGGRGDDV